MGLLRIQTLTGRPQPAGSSPTPGPQQLSILQPLLRKSLFILLAIALLSLATAAQKASNQAGASSGRSPKSTVLNVTSQQPAAPAADDSQPSALPGQSASINVNSSSSDVSGGQSQSSVSVNVNGQSIDVPDNGTTQQTVTTPDGSTDVNITNTPSASGNNFNSSFTTTPSNINSGDANSSVRIQINNGSSGP